MTDPMPKLADDGRPIWERIAELAEKLPDEMAKQCPTDGATQHDHYLYGSPKTMTTPQQIDYMDDEMVAAFHKSPFYGADVFYAGWRAAMVAAHAKVNAEHAALRTALADAISSPMGVVPASAEQFYDATKGMVKP